MAQNHNRNLFGNWKLVLIVISVIPVFLLGSIYIEYGWYFNSIDTQDNSLLNFIKLSTQYNILNTTTELPLVVRTIGLTSVNFLSLLFYLFFMTHIFSAYVSLEKQIANMTLLLIEWFITLLLFILVIYPESVLLIVVSFFFLLLDLIVILSYFFYKLKSKR